MKEDPNMEEATSVLELRTRWLDALRSGEYTQTLRTLRMNDSYCCLGVACDVMFPDAWEPSVDHGDGRRCYRTISEEETYMPKKVWQEMGFRSRTGSFPPGVNVGRNELGELARMQEGPGFGVFAASLSQINDVLGASFPEIANFVEAYPELVWADSEEVQ